MEPAASFLSFFGEELANGITWGHLIAAVIVLFVVAQVSKRMRRGSTIQQHNASSKRCTQCDWYGPTGRFNQECPKCRAQLVDLQG